jgi:hypothetical protein
MHRARTTVLVCSLLFLLPAAGSRADVLVDGMEGPKSNQARSGGYWFLFVDAKSKERGNTEILYPDGYGYNFRYDTGGYQSDHCARMKARIGAGYEYPFVGMGMNLDQYKRPYDFCKIEAIEFRARGRGVFKLKLRDTWGVRQTPREEYSHEFTVSPEWKRYSLRPEDFTVSLSSPLRTHGRRWEGVCDSITSLIFVTASYAARDAGTVVDLRVDDIVIRGLDTVGVAHGSAPAREPTVPITRFSIDIHDDIPEDEEERVE